ncbi:MAG: OstA-like protein [Bacteroidota bacterium]|nr:OstA-like protein [Bacteroidota bacterium]
MSFITAFLLQGMQAQESKKVKLLGADKLIGIKKNGQQIQVLQGNVKLQHENTFFYCDSANLNRETNSFRAFYNIHIIVNDSVNIYGDSLDYSGENRMAELYGKVKLVDNKATLYTDYLIYNRTTNIASYITWGRIVDAENELVSSIGYYYSDQNEFFFKQDVIVNTPDYIMYSDTLKYNTDTETAFIYGPTHMIGAEDSIYCERGWYDTKQDISHLKKNVFIRHLEQSIKADSVYYDKEAGFGEAIMHVVIFDTVQDGMVKGNFAQYFKDRQLAFVTDSAVAIFIDEKNQDSLFLHGDTLKVLMDSSNQAREMLAFNHVKFFKDDLQGACDSMVYKVADSLIWMYNGPMIWSDDNQITSDSIKLALSNNQIDSIVFYNSSFIISIDDSGSFNQIKGKNMVGYFKNNEMYKLRIIGNSETIFFVRDDQTQELMGINKLVASDMLVFIRDREISTITYITMPKASMYPPGDLQENELFLKGFDWYGYQRPRVKWEIFYWKEDPDAGSED